MNLNQIEKLSKTESKTIMERTVKLQEEVGELAQEVLIAAKASGLQYKVASHDGIKGECADILIVALSIFFADGGTAEELEALVGAKCQKWAKHQVPN